MAALTILTIGNFDGVHAGHRAILARAREVADASGGRVVAMSFFPHPATVLRPEAAPALLTDYNERERVLRGAGADAVVRLEPEASLLSQPAGSFIEQIVGDYAPVAIVEGADFRFGKGRAGDLAMLRRAGARHGFEVHTVDPVEVALTNQQIVRASSTHARWLVELGRVADAALVLGRPYRLTGTVTRGDRRGREIGCPTANLATPCLLPADGVYAGIAHIPGGARMPAAIHVGPRATFGQPERVVEAHVLDWPGPDLNAGEPEYGWPIGLDVCAWLRDQVRFDGVEPLMSQIGRDVERTREELRTES